MDRSGTKQSLCAAAMRLGGLASFELLPCAPAQGKHSQLRLDEADRRPVHATAILRITPHNRLAEPFGLGRQRETGSAVNAADGDSLHPARTEHQPPTPRPSQISLPLAGPCYTGSKSGLVRGHHVHSLAAGASVSGGHYGLVQSLCVGLGAVEFDGNGVLSSGIESGAVAGHTGDIEYRSRDSVHQRSVHWTAEGRRDRDQHGWPGRALDNVFIERLWWSVKYEEVYPSDYADGHVAHRQLGKYFRFYNNERRHQALDRQTPREVYLNRCTATDSQPALGGAPRFFQAAN